MSELLNKKEYFEKKSEFDRPKWIEEIAEERARSYKEIVINILNDYSDTKIIKEYEKIEDGE